MNEEKLVIPYPVIVEGKYDRQKLASVIDAQMITQTASGSSKTAKKPRSYVRSPKKRRS